MWAKVAEEMQVPWRAAEAMHWQLGENEMARRAGVVPFSLSSATADPPPPHSTHRVSPSRGHHHSQSQGSLVRDMSGGVPPGPYGRGAPGPPPVGLPPPAAHPRPLATRREGMAPRPPGPEPPEPLYYGPGGPGLAPIQAGPHQGRGGMLPGVAELTTGVSPYMTPAYATGMPTTSPVPSQTASPGPVGPGMYLDPGAGKRRASPDSGHRDMRRPQFDPRYDGGGGGGPGESSRRMV